MCKMHRDDRGGSNIPDGGGGGGGATASGGDGHRRGRAVSYLMYACQQSDIDAVRQILRVQGRAAATRRDRTGKSPLHYCCTSKRRARGAQAADLLVMAAPELIDGRDEDGFTPLHLAVIAGNMPLVTFLLANNADVKAVDAEQHTVVHWATVCGETEALRAVLSADAPISTPDVHGGYPLHYAAQMCATSHDKENEIGMVILQTLLSHSKIDVTVRDGDGRQPLLWAASAGSPKAMLALIRAGAPVEASDKDGLTALHCAASRGHTECLDTLLTLCGSSVDVIDSNGCTALHYAVTLGHADATALLLAHGANANRQDRKGRTPAHCGCAKGQIETVKMLAMHDANLWLRNARGDLPLHEAAGSGRRDLVKWLLEAKPSNVNARNNDGRCPLHLAALNDNADMCKILIDHGAIINPVLRTSKNAFMTPLDCALQRGFRSTAKYLQLQGGLPASKLGTTGNHIQVNIRENITVDVSQSTDDESMLEVDEKRKKSRKKRRDISLKPQEVAIVNTEVKVSDRNVNIQQSKSLKLSNGNLTVDTAKSERSSARLSAKKEPAKPERLSARSTKKDTPDPRRKAMTTQTVELSPLRINENIKEINTLAQCIESKAKSICQEVSHIETNLDQQSLTSFEEGQESQQIVVEAAVHNPPGKMDTSVHQQYQEVITSLKDELDSLRNEITSLKKVEVQAQAQAASSKSNEKAGKEIDNDTLKELKQLLEGRVLEIKETVEEFKTDIKSAIDSQIPKRDGTVESGELTKVDVDLIRCLEKKVRELERAAAHMQREVKSETELVKEDMKVTTKSRSRASSGQKKLKQEAKAAEENKIELAKPETQTTTEEVIENVVVASEALMAVEKLEEKDVAQTQKEEIIQETVIQKDVAADVFGETVTQQTREDMLKMTSDIEAKLAEAVVVEELREIEQEKTENIADKSQTVAEITEEGNKEEIDKAFEVLQTTVVDNPLSIDETAPETELDDSKAFEVLPQSEEQEVQDESLTTDLKDEEEEDETDKKAFEVLESEGATSPDKPTEESISPQSPDEPKTKRFIKTGKRDHHLHLPRNETRESSFEDANSESSFSSSATKREHKSFTIIDPQTASIGKASKTPGSSKKKKIRSRSEEMRKNGELLLRRGKTSGTEDESDRRRAKSNLESRIPTLPNLSNKYKTKSETNISGMEEFSEHSDDDIPDSDQKRKRVRKRAKSRTTKSAGSDYESSNLIDSGFEPSPRSTRIPKWRNMSDRGVNMMSVTQSIQGNIRKYHLERKIFQHLLELKRLQIRAGQHNEVILVKRAIDAYHRSCASTVGGGRYVPQDYTFKSFEKFLYESLRKIQKHTAPEYLRGLPESAIENPLFCTQSTNRCMHATHAYTGVPCAAYLPKMDHHTIPKIGFSSSTACKPQGFLPDINKKAVTLELCHGNDKQVISLPTDRLDQNKRYYVTFTVKGESEDSPPENQMAEQSKTPTHQHSKSM